MRPKRLGAALVLLILSACSGGDDVTAPPAGTFTLTVAPGGTGSGRVATAGGVEPAISCDLAGTATTGICSATYPAGTAVSLTVTPATGVAFTGWAGDAASCGTALSCSLTMSENQTATVQLGAAATPEVQVASSAFYPDPELGEEGAVVWVVEVRNATTQVVETAEVVFTSKDASGQNLVSSSTSIGPIPPGETRVEQGLAEYTGTEATADFQVTAVQFSSGPSNLGAAEIVASDWQIDPDLAAEGLIPWSVEVRNTTSSELETVEIGFSTYDAAGKIVSVSFAFLGPIPPGATESSENFADYYGTEATARFQVTGVGPELTATRRPMVSRR